MGFRIAFYYGLLVTITMLLTVSIIYTQTIGVMSSGIIRQLQSSNQKFVAVYEKSGQQSLVAEIERTLLTQGNGTTDLFLYLDYKGQKLVGNFDLPLLKKENVEINGQRTVLLDGINVQAQLVSDLLSDGSQLLVGSNLRDLESFDNLVKKGISAACGVAVVFLIGGLLLFRQELERSIKTIRHTLVRVAHGELKERVAPLGQQDEFALLGNDINKMLDQLELLMSGISHVSNTIAHNLRTPLTRIHLRLRNIANEVSPAAEHRADIEATLRDIEDLTSVFEKLLQIAETEAGSSRIALTKIQPSSVVTEALDYYQTVAEATGAKLLWECVGRGSIQGDAELLSQAIANLIDNALKYGGHGVTVTLRCETLRDQIHITVSDNGPGIPSSAMDRVGTRFFRVDRTTAGHGLGLASVGAIVALHKGKLAFEDAQPGLKVTVSFPAS
jgi:signal transduction histidine kinase